jgi:hypothetical protein
VESGQTRFAWNRHRCNRLCRELGVGRRQSCVRPATAWWAGPTHLVRVGRTLIPVEQKPSAHRVQLSNVLQVAAQCLLVDEVYGVRPPYGLLVLAGGVREQIQFTPALTAAPRDDGADAPTAQFGSRSWAAVDCAEVPSVWLSQDMLRLAFLALALRSRPWVLPIRVPCQCPDRLACAHCDLL